MIQQYMYPIPYVQYGNSGAAQNCSYVRVRRRIISIAGSRGYRLPCLPVTTVTDYRGYRFYEVLQQYQLFFLRQSLNTARPPANRLGTILYVFQTHRVVRNIFRVASLFSCVYVFTYIQKYYYILIIIIYLWH